MNEIVNNEPKNENVTCADLGAFLKKDRERHGWDIAYVGSALHLDNWIIVALEKEDFEKLAGAVFVQGYLRKYARLLDQPPEEFLRAYANICPKQDNCQALRFGIEKKQINSSHTLMRSVSFLIVSGMITLMLLWWAGYLQEHEPGFIQRAIEEFEGSEQSHDNISISGIAATEAPTQTLVEQVEQPSLPDTIPNPVASQSAVMSVAVAQEDTSADTSREEVDEIAENSPELSVEQTTEKSVAVIDSSELTSETTPDIKEIRTPLNAARSQFSVDLYFDKASWVDVRDNTGKLLIIGEIAAGEHHQLTQGKLPFSIVLGRANNVRIVVNGEPFDLTQHSRKNVARFKLSSNLLGLSE